MSKVFISKDEYVDINIDSKVVVEPMDIYSKLASIWFNVPYEKCLEYVDEHFHKEGKQRRNFIKKLLVKVAFGKQLDDNENNCYEFLCDKYDFLVNLENCGVEFSSSGYFNLPQFLYLLFESHLQMDVLRVPLDFGFWLKTSNR